MLKLFLLINNSRDFFFPGKGASSYKVALPTAAKSKTKPAPLDVS